MDFRFLKRRRLAVLIIGFLFAVMGTGLLPLAVQSLRSAYRMGDPGATRTLTAQIVKLHKSSGRSGTSYYVDYTYQVGAMTVRVGTVDVSADNWQQLGPVGTSLPVNILVADPTVSEPALTGQQEFAEFYGWLFVVCCLFIVGLGYWIALFSEKGRATRRTRKKPDAA
jgi:hypothetical protein